MPPIRAQETANSYPHPKSRGTRHANIFRGNFDDVNARSQQAEKEGGKINSTIESYRGHIKRARAWLAEIVEDEKRREKEWEAEKAQHPIDEPPAGNRKSSMPVDMEYAFTDKPIECTPLAIKMFMTEKCFGEENCTGSTAECIRSAFIWHYKCLDPIYDGEWRYDFFRKCWVGNPARCPSITAVVKSCLTKDSEHARRHAKAMSLGDMEKIHDYLTSTCPDLSQCTTNEVLRERANVLWWKAFTSLSFIVWTRCCEATKLQAKHIIRTPEPLWTRNGFDPRPYITINLENRKNWTTKIRNDDDTLNGHTYHIPTNPDQPAIDAYFHVQEWLNFYERYLLQRPLSPEDYIFPTLKTGGGRVTPDSTNHISTDTVCRRLGKLTEKAGLPGHYTTHCFRRGGAQYRFLRAPRHSRWALDRVRWWAGWAEGDHTHDMLIKYLLDELETYETGHNDALFWDGIPDDGVHGQQMDTGLDQRCLTAGEGKDLFAAAASQMERFNESLQKLAASQTAPNITYNYPIIAPQPIAYPHYPCPGYSDNIGPYPQSTFHAPPSAFNGVSPPSVPVISPVHHPNTPNTYGYSNPSNSYDYSNMSSTNSQPNFSNTYNYASTQPSTQIHGLSSSPPPTTVVNSLSAPIIPEISRSLGADAWRQVIKDWDFADPARNHHRPLGELTAKDFPKNQRQLFHLRQMIALEFIDVYHRDEARFLADYYPAYVNGATPLATAIRQKKQDAGLLPHRNRGPHVY